MNGHWRNDDDVIEDGYSRENQEMKPVWWRRALGQVRRKTSELPQQGFNAGSLGASYVRDGIDNVVGRVDDKFEKLNNWAQRTWVGGFFTLKDRKTKFSSEIRAGTISFLMIVYVLALNPQIIGSTGGTCNAKELCTDVQYQVQGESCLFTTDNPAAGQCLETFKMSLTTATAIASLVSCFIIGFFANLPMGLAPGIGINVYFAYQVVGQGTLTYEQALVAIFLEGFFFIILSLSGARGAIMRHMPASIAFAGSVGMGLLLAYTGLRNLGVIVFDGTTLTTLGGCPANDSLSVYVGPQILDLDNLTLILEDDSDNSSYQVNVSLENIDEASRNVYACASKEMRSPTMWLGISGGIIMSLLTAWRVKGALIIGVAFVTIISWIPGHGASYLGAGSPIPGGEIRMDTFSQVVAAPTLEGSGLQWDWSAVGDGHFWFVLFTLLYIDILDCTGVLLSMAFLLDDYLQMDYYGVTDIHSVKDKKQSLAEANGGEERNPYVPFISDKKEFKGQQWAFLADGVGIIVCSMVGISPVNVYLESAAGIEEGGRTGIVPIVVSFFFFVSLFFSPILSSIPPYATGPALILVGIMLIAHADHIPWDDPYDAIPAFLTIVVMPFSYSVAYGVVAGLVMYLILRIPKWLSELFMYVKEYYYPSDDQMDDGATQSSISRSVLRKKTMTRKVFGNLSVRESEAESLDGVVIRDVPPADNVPIPGARRLQQSRSHQGWYGSQSPRKIMESPSPSDRYIPDKYLEDNSPPQEGLARQNAYNGPIFPSLSTSLKRSASFNPVGNSGAMEDQDNIQLFGDFQLLDLDLGSSGSSVDEEQIQLQSDGTLGLVSRKSIEAAAADMLNFQQGNLQSMEQIKEEEHELHHDGKVSHTREISLAPLDQTSSFATDAAEVSPSRQFRRSQTSASMASSTSQLSAEQRSMSRTASAAAIRLKNLFPDADVQDDPQ